MNNYAEFVQMVNSGEWDGPIQLGVRRYRYIQELFEEHGLESPFRVTLLTFRNRLRKAERERREREVIGNILNSL